MEGSLVAYKVFTNGSVLQASEVNENLMQQAVIAFNNVSARTAAIPSPIEGMTTYLADSDTIQIYDGSAWKISLATTGGILQVVNATSTTAVSATTNAFVSSGLAATITPRSTNSRIIISATYPVENSTTLSASVWTLFRGTVAGTNLGASAVGSAGFHQAYNASSSVRISGSIYHVDSPATISPTTYTVAFNPGLTGNATAMGEGRRGTITLMEVAG